MAQVIPTELGTESIGRLLRKYAIPAIIAMTASSLYNMIDSIFIGQGVGPLAISGLAVTFPLMNISAAFGSLVGVGASAIVSMLLGQKNYGVARRVLGNVMTMNVVLGVLLMFFGLLFLDPILYFFGASENIISYAREYMIYILLGNVITHLYLGLNAVLRAAGRPKVAMWLTILTVVLNAILDPLFIFVFDMGIKGAAIATVLAQTVSLVWQLRLLTNKNEVLHFENGKVFTYDRKIARESLKIGLSPFLMNMASCFVVLLINNQLRRYGDQMGEGVGDIAIGAYGIVNRIIFLFVMIVMGFNQGMQPIAGYNYGAGNYDRVLKVFWQTVGWATLCTTLGFVVGVFVPEVAVRLFTSDAMMIDIAANGFTIAVVAFPIVGIGMVASNFFQSIGMAGKAIFLSLSRQVLFLIPCLVVVPLFFDIRGVWMALPISDAISSVVSVVLIVGLIRKFKQSPQTIGFKGVEGVESENQTKE
ncbi:MAG: MATE family efflux transporter [Tidjanibacter sp.]|nr:MATE family efflux transporter [Tidjanibacter sp.]